MTDAPDNDLKIVKASKDLIEDIHSLIHLILWKASHGVSKKLHKWANPLHISRVTIKA